MLLPAARERLARIALVKPEKARGVEDLVLQAAQRGQIVERVRSTAPPHSAEGFRFGASWGTARGVEDPAWFRSPSDPGARALPGVLT